MATYKKLATKYIGPGGMHCSCCTPYSKGKKNKRLVNRLVRRTDFINLKIK